MEIGLYRAKYPARKLIQGVLPLVRNVEPNTVSWAMLPIGAATAVALWSASGSPWLYGVVILLIVTRMFLGTLDGLMAVTMEKSSPWGEVVNRLAPELCDLMLLGAIVLRRPDWFGLGVLTLLMGWLTTFVGILGATAGRQTQSVGPVGQTDRLAALIVFLLAQAVCDLNLWHVDVMPAFLMWLSLGGLFTVALRLRRLRNDCLSARP